VDYNLKAETGIFRTSAPELPVSKFSEGYEAEKGGKTLLDNPYLSASAPFSIEARQWVDGYVKSMQDRKNVHS
jgi:hypothetical protein